MSAQPVIRHPGENKGVTLAGQPMAFLVTGPDTQHTSMFEWTLPPGLSTGLHVHRVQEETFYVLEGTCEWRVGEQVVQATPGTFLFIPPGVPHNIANVSGQPTKLFMTVSPPGHENYFVELAALLTDAGRPDPEVLAALRRRYDTEQISGLTTS